MDSLVNPLCSSMKSVGHKVKTVPDSFMDGIKDGLVKVLGNRSASPDSETVPESCKVAAGLDVEVIFFVILRYNIFLNISKINL